jgi:lysophospholipase L1-like esterase
VIDFDKIVRDAQHSEQMLAAFDSGDHLHPSPAGYAAMAEGIQLSLFTSVKRHFHGEVNHAADQRR